MAAPPDYNTVTADASAPPPGAYPLQDQTPQPYPPQQQPYAPQQEAYPPQQQPYPPQQQPYPPQQQPPQQAPYQNYPAPTYPPPIQQQQSNTTVVVTQQQAQQVQVIKTKDKPNHVLHFIICLFCPWYFWIWLIICCIYGC